MCFKFGNVVDMYDVPVVGEYVPVAGTAVGIVDESYDVPDVGTVDELYDGTVDELYDSTVDEP